MDVLDDRRLRHHPRRPTFTAATLAAASPLPPSPTQPASDNYAQVILPDITEFQPSEIKLDARLML